MEINFLRTHARTHEERDMYPGWTQKDSPAPDIPSAVINGICHRHA